MRLAVALAVVRVRRLAHLREAVRVGAVVHDRAAARIRAPRDHSIVSARLLDDRPVRDAKGCRAASAALMLSRPLGLELLHLTLRLRTGSLTLAGDDLIVVRRARLQIGDADAMVLRLRRFVIRVRRLGGLIEVVAVGAVLHYGATASVGGPCDHCPTLSRSFDIRTVSDAFRLWFSRGLRRECHRGCGESSAHDPNCCSSVHSKSPDPVLSKWRFSGY